jgi:hypothetical protein
MPTDAGFYEYSDEQYTALVEVFGGEPPIAEGESEFVPPAEESLNPWIPEPVSQDQIPIRSKSKEKPMKWEMGTVRENDSVAQQEGITREEADKLFMDSIVQTPEFEKLVRTDQGVVRAEEASHDDGVVSLLRRQQEYFEQRIESGIMKELESLRRENYNLKKELLASRKELDTLNHILRNQNMDKQYLIERLNQKYSLKNLFQWKQDREHFEVG